MIRAVNVSKKYAVGETEIAALNGMDFAIEEGQFAVVLGPSGAGKTTLLNLIGGMDTLSDGLSSAAKISVRSAKNSSPSIGGIAWGSCFSFIT